MKTQIVEVTNGPKNWGKILIGQFDEEWSIPSVVGEHDSIMAARGWTPGHVLVLDLETGEGALFRLGGHARNDLDKHRIWVCPMFEHFLHWLYEQPRDVLANLPPVVDLPDAPFEMAGYRRPGPQSP